MNVVFSNITYANVKEKRAEALRNSHSIHAVKEESVHFLLKRLPFLVVYLIYAYVIINNCFSPVFMTIFNYFNSSIGNASAGNPVDAAPVAVLSGTVSCGIFLIALIFAYKIWFALVRRVVPRHTPISDKERINERFWRESENIEKTLAVMDEISKLRPEDIAYSEILIERETDEITLFLKDSKWGLTIKQKFSVSHAAMMKKLRESGELDFSFMDKEWSALLQKYSPKKTHFIRNCI